MEFVKGALKIGLAIVFAVVMLSLLGALAKLAFDWHHGREAKKYEIVKYHELALSKPLNLKLYGKTKLVDGTMYVEVKFDGYPDYLNFPTNVTSEAAGFTILFLDSDGFTLKEERIPLRKFTALHENGKPTGISHEFTSFMTPETYVRLKRLNLTWNMQLDPPKRNIFDQFDEVKDKRLDPCAPNLSKAKRLKRLEKYGTVRQTGMGEYTAGNHVVKYLGGGSELYDCR